ncbi:MAG: DUF2283 domain-containing protein [archaeon]
MRVHFDKKADALCIRFSEDKYFESEEFREGFIADFNKSGKVIGLEILGVSKNLPKEALRKFSFEMDEKEFATAQE